MADDELPWSAARDRFRRDIPHKARLSALIGLPDPTTGITAPITRPDIQAGSIRTAVCVPNPIPKLEISLSCRPPHLTYQTHLPNTPANPNADPIPCQPRQYAIWLKLMHRSANGWSKGYGADGPGHG